MSPKLARLALVLSLFLVAAACGSDEPVTVDSAAAGQDSESDGLPDGPIPVEPDGGIGDGAEPLPGYEEPADEGTWHGQEVAVTNCPGMEWKRVQASEFSFSVPADFVETDAEPIDSEIGMWTGPGTAAGDTVEVSFDYGWYSGSLSDTSGAENEPVDYTGIVGERTIVRGAAETMVSVYFGEVNEVGGEWDKLGMVVRVSNPNDEIIGRCVVRSIEWNEQ